MFIGICDGKFPRIIIRKSPCLQLCDYMHIFSTTIFIRLKDRVFVPIE